MDRKTNILVSGGASSGADAWTKTKARELGWDYIEVPALWSDGKGLGIGPKRNGLIAHLVDRAVVIWDGESKGTMGFMNRMNALGKPYWTVQL